MIIEERTICCDNCGVKGKNTLEFVDDAKQPIDLKKIVKKYDSKVYEDGYCEFIQFTLAQVCNVQYCLTCVRQFSNDFEHMKNNEI